jgi:superfamily I DNA/RNA helicase
VSLFSVAMTKDFTKNLGVLRKGGRVDAHKKVCAALTEANLYGRITLERTHHGEDRLPDCEKYDLGGGYRLVVQMVDTDKGHRAFLFVGSHDDAEYWIERHRNYRWVRRESDNTLDFVQITPSDRSEPPLLAVDLSAPSHLSDAPLLADLDDRLLQEICADPSFREYVRAVTRSDWERDGNGVLRHIESRGNLQLACLFCDLFTHAYDNRPDLLRLRAERECGAASVAPNVDVAEAMLSPANSERYLTWDDSDEVPAIENWQEWMLFLHPTQRDVATRDYDGPARLRGVSGSGKTCVMIHRARHLAKKYAAPVAVLTLTGSTCKLLDRMLRDLCGAEIARIETHTLSAFVKDVLDRHHPRGNRWYRFPSAQESDQIRREVLNAVFQSPEVLSSTINFMPDKEEFIWDVLQYVRTRLPAESYNEFLDGKAFLRHGALTHQVRKVVVEGCASLDKALEARHCLDNEGLVQEAFKLVAHAAATGTALPGRYRAILVDEVQDCTQMELRLLARLWTPDGEQIASASDGLFLVGDGAQTVYKKGFSLRQLGIDVTGRSEVLKKNYRNSREILEAAYSLVADYEYADVDEDSVRRPQSPDVASRRGDRPQIVLCKSRQDEAEEVAARVQQLLGEGVMAGQICVIGVSPDHRKHCSRMLAERGVRWVELRADADYDSEHVKVSTIESAKGHDFVAVFVVGVNRGLLPARGAEGVPSEEAREASRLYVAMTRATHYLTLTCSSGQHERPSEFLARIERFADQFRRTADGVVPVS